METVLGDSTPCSPAVHRGDVPSSHLLSPGLGEMLSPGERWAQMLH